MQFVRTVVESSRLENVIAIPKEFNPDDFEGILNIDADEIEKDIKNMRDEWERI